jgi:hypothetical protein
MPMRPLTAYRHIYDKFLTRIERFVAASSMTREWIVIDNDCSRRIHLYAHVLVWSCGRPHACMRIHARLLNSVLACVVANPI